jgi:hypothetical protein
MFVRPFREPIAIVTIAIASFVPTVACAGQHRAQPFGASHVPAFTFSIGHRASPVSSSIHLRDFSHAHEPLKTFEIATPPPKAEPTFPSFANPLHRHRMAMIAF